MAGLGVGNGVLRFVKQRLQGFMTVPLPDTSAYLGLSECFLQCPCCITVEAALMRFAWTCETTGGKLSTQSCLAANDSLCLHAAGADVGVLLPLGPGAAAKRTPISDRFFLGGAGSLRGFHANSAGPFSERRGAPSQVPPTCLSVRDGHRPQLSTWPDSHCRIMTQLCYLHRHGESPPSRRC